MRGGAQKTGPHMVGPMDGAVLGAALSFHCSGMKEDGRPNHAQKRVDMMMGVDMALLAVKHRVDRIALLTGDSDAIPTVEAVKPEGIVATLVHGPEKGGARPSRELYKLADDRVEIDDAMGPRTEARFLSGSFLEPRFVQPPVSVGSLQRLVVFHTVDR